MLHCKEFQYSHYCSATFTLSGLGTGTKHIDMGMVEVNKTKYNYWKAQMLCGVFAEPKIDYKIEMKKILI